MPPSYFIYGLHSVTYALKNPQRHCKELILTPSAYEKLREDSSLNLSRIQVHMREPKAINVLVGENIVHQGCVLVCEPLGGVTLDGWLQKLKLNQSTVLILDNVSDPQNVGALLRTAAAFKVGAMIVHDRHSPPNHTPSLIKAASGGAELVPIIRATNIAQAIATLKDHNFWCIGLSEHASVDITQVPTYDRKALVLGSEGHGMRSLVSQKCDLNLKLPTNPLFSTLNVSVAGAVALTLLRHHE